MLKYLFIISVVTRGMSSSSFSELIWFTLTICDPDQSDHNANPVGLLCVFLDWYISTNQHTHSINLSKTNICNKYDNTQKEKIKERKIEGKKKERKKERKIRKTLYANNILNAFSRKRQQEQKKIFQATPGTPP